MHVSKRSTRLVSVCLHQLCLLVTSQLICHPANCDAIKPRKSTVTNPSTHRAQRDTTSSLRIEDWQDATTADDRVTENTEVLNLNGSDFSKTNETSAINASASVKKVSSADSGLVSMATVGNGVTSLVGRQVPGHVTSLTHFSPTSASHVTNATTDRETTSKGPGNSSQDPLRSAAGDVILTSSHSVRSNSVTTPPPVTSPLLRETTANSSEGAWESSTTHVELKALQQTTHSDNGSLDQLMTSANVTSPHHALVPIDRGQSVIITSPKEVMFPRCLSVCFVCLLATLHKNFQTDLHQIFREDWK